MNSVSDIAEEIKVDIQWEFNYNMGKRHINHKWFNTFWIENDSRKPGTGTILEFNVKYPTGDDPQNIDVFGIMKDAVDLVIEETNDRLPDYYSVESNYKEQKNTLFVEVYILYTPPT